MGAKAILWAFWGVESILALVFAIMALVVFGSVSHVKQYAANYQGYFLNSILASAILSAILVLGFLILSLVFLIKKQAYHQGFAGFAAGVNLAGSFMLSLFVLLACIVLTSGKTELGTWERYDNSWNSGSSVLYVATFSIGYILAGLYMIHAFLFFFLRHAFEDVIQDVETKHESAYLSSSSPEKQSDATPAYAAGSKPARPAAASSSVAAPVTTSTATPQASAASSGVTSGAAAAPTPAYQAGGGLHGGPSTASPFHKEEEPIAAT